ncbi:hypothetical protein SESBI_03370 [Sesbania bispinosa]|nr:hypothetical protein SESBI_03370 [Sesbania bispinosa]
MAPPSEPSLVQPLYSPRQDPASCVASHHGSWSRHHQPQLHRAPSMEERGGELRGTVEEGQRRWEMERDGGQRKRDGGEREGSMGRGRASRRGKREVLE